MCYPTHTIEAHLRTCAFIQGPSTGCVYLIIQNASLQVVYTLVQAYLTGWLLIMTLCQNETDDYSKYSCTNKMFSQCHLTPVYTCFYALWCSYKIDIVNPSPSLCPLVRSGHRHVMVSPVFISYPPHRGHGRTALSTCVKNTTAA